MALAEALVPVVLGVIGLAWVAIAIVGLVNE